MATYQLLFSNNQLGNFNTANFTGGYLGSQNLRINNAHPGDRLVAAGAVNSRSEITGWRLTVEGQGPMGEQTVIPNAPMTIEYSTDGGATWHSYAVGINLPDSVWYARQDEAGWMAIVADVPGQSDGQMGFIVADAGVTPGQIFTTDETVFETQTGEYLLPCFARDTLIQTDRGTVAVQDLAVGDLVMTRDNGLRPIRWIASRRIDSFAGREHLRPIRIAAGALGAGQPSAELVVSPQHRVLVRSMIAQRMFGTDEVLVAAKQLCGIEGIGIDTTAQDVEYFHILFDRHEIVTSNGALTESLFTGREALKSVGHAAREEIFELFPELRDDDHEPAAARMLTTGSMGRRLAARHQQNGKPLVN